MQLKTIKKKKNDRRATMTVEANFNSCQKIPLVSNKFFDFVCLFRLIIHNLKLLFRVWRMRLILFRSKSELLSLWKRLNELLHWRTKRIWSSLTLQRKRQRRKFSDSWIRSTISTTFSTSIMIIIKIEFCKKIRQSLIHHFLHLMIDTLWSLK
jgi:hypothetical protein